VIKQFSGSGYESSDAMVIDELELQRHLQLEKLYKSTRSGRVMLKLIFQGEELREWFTYKLIILQISSGKLDKLEIFVC
jgi:hypothetical protein